MADYIRHLGDQITALSPTDTGSLLQYLEKYEFNKSIRATESGIAYQRGATF
ncbi:MAG TPA: hypothetical protein VMM76_01030 [Pirellulaceae bacterium]|nr:hypothetical protein [Pirellulaceae bacterium]